MEKNITTKTSQKRAIEKLEEEITKKHGEIVKLLAYKASPGEDRGPMSQFFFQTVTQEESFYHAAKKYNTLVELKRNLEERQ